MKPISKEYLRRHLPPNVEAERAHDLIWGLLIGCAVIGFIVFACRYYRCYNDLFYYREGRRLIREGMLMPSFPRVIRGMCMVSGWEIWMALGYSLKLRGSFFSGSQSIYLMRRLPDGRRTLRHMVTDVPLRWALWTVLLWLLSVAVAFLLWRFCTPAACLPL